MNGIVLKPAPPANAILLIDNLALAAHKDAGFRALIAGAGAKRVFLPPYSPECHPIELAWRKMQRWLRTARRRTREALDAALSRVMGSVSPNAATGWFRRCGWKYRAQ